MAPISLINYGIHGRFLEAKGWRIKPTSVTLGTAYVDAKNKTIYMKASAFARPSIRVRRYVVRHEIWHALHAEVMDYACHELREKRSLDVMSAIETVGEAGCLFQDQTRLMRTWVAASVAWHGRARRGTYKMADIKSPEATAIIHSLHAAVQEWAKNG